MIGYVTIQKQSILGMVSILGVPSGKKRVLQSGKVEAEFICIRKADNCETVWATQKELVV